MKGVGEPCAGEPHARFDGRGLETERISVTAPAPDPTILSAWLNMVSMRCLLWLALNARRAAHAQISMVDRMDAIVHPAAQGRHEPTSHR